MASIDQLFQKANKKKKSKINSANFLETERKNDETRRKKQEEAKINETMPQASENIYFNKILQDDKDWKPVDEFEAREVIDTTNIRVQNLEITDNYVNQNQKSNTTTNEDNNEYGDDVLGGEVDEEALAASKSWATTLTSSSPPSDDSIFHKAEMGKEAAPVVPEVAVKKDANAVYVPIHLLEAEMGVAPKRYVPAKPRPDVNNAFEFPTLGELSVEEAAAKGNNSKAATESPGDNSEWIKAKAKMPTEFVTQSNVYVPAHKRIGANQFSGLSQPAAPPPMSNSDTVTTTNKPAPATASSNIYMPPQKRMGLNVSQNRFAT